MFKNQNFEKEEIFLIKKFNVKVQQNQSYLWIDGIRLIKFIESIFT